MKHTKRWLMIAAILLLAGLTLAPSPPSDRHPTGDGRTA